MAREYVFDIRGEEYKGETASAKEQFEALHVAMRTTLVSILDEKEHSEMAVVGFFARVDFEDLQKLVKLLVHEKVFKREGDIPVYENLFQDRIQDYYLLVYHALRENLGGFWALRRPTAGKAAEPETS